MALSSKRNVSVNASCGLNHRDSHQGCSTKKALLKNFAIFTGKQQCWSLFLIKLQTGTFIKKRLQQSCFPVNIVKSSRTPILKNICERLLLKPSWIIFNIHLIFACTIDPRNEFEIPQIKRTLPLEIQRKLSMPKTFLKLRGHLLNVLCTFNVRFVSRGYQTCQLSQCRWNSPSFEGRLHVSQEFC